ncbi:VOC family protein [Mucilaginibacter sp. McL0603]|uniref:VOC family protein n=1 Tax=Mucilaginibacter sp. McL0603 TaxID=3415670 RepID=UPI003CFB01C1
MYIDHTTLRTSELEKTKEFLIRVFDLQPGERPAVIAANIPGYWLYYQDKPIIHLIRSSFFHKMAVDNSSEAIDHTAFFMKDFEAFKLRLTALKIHFSLMDLPDIGERRIFLRTPTGILLETVFRETA